MSSRRNLAGAGALDSASLRRFMIPIDDLSQAKGLYLLRFWSIFLIGASTLVGGSASAQSVNDSFADRILLTGSLIATNGSNVGATKESGEPDHAGAAGGKSVWWSWTAPQSGVVRIGTSGSSFDTLLAVYTGGSLETLEVVASNDN